MKELDTRIYTYPHPSNPKLLRHTQQRAVTQLSSDVSGSGGTDPQLDWAYSLPMCTDISHVLSLIHI